MALNKIYRDTRLPAHVRKMVERNAVQQILEHFQYMYHQKRMFEKRYNKKLIEIRRLKKEIDELTKNR